MAFAPLRVKHGTAIGPFETPLGMLVESLPLAAMILASESVALDAEADDGLHAEFAKASERARDAKKWVSDLDATSAKLLVAAETLRIELESGDLPDGTDSATLQAELEQAEADAASAYRQYVDAMSRSRKLDERANELDPERLAGGLDPEIWRSYTSRDDLADE